MLPGYSQLIPIFKNCPYPFHRLLVGCVFFFFSFNSCGKFWSEHGIWKKSYTFGHFVVVAVVIVLLLKSVRTVVVSVRFIPHRTAMVRHWSGAFRFRGRWLKLHDKLHAPPIRKASATEVACLHARKRLRNGWPNGPKWLSLYWPREWALFIVRPLKSGDFCIAGTRKSFLAYGMDTNNVHKCYIWLWIFCLENG